jgi:hypothetical protein
VAKNYPQGEKLTEKTAALSHNIFSTLLFEIEFKLGCVNVSYENSNYKKKNQIIL